MPRVLHGSSGSVGDVAGETALFRSIDSLLLRAVSPISLGDTLCMHRAEQKLLNERSTVGVLTDTNAADIASDRDSGNKLFRTCDLGDLDKIGFCLFDFSACLSFSLFPYSFFLFFFFWLDLLETRR